MEIFHFYLAFTVGRSQEFKTWGLISWIEPLLTSFTQFKIKITRVSCILHYKKPWKFKRSIPKFKSLDICCSVPFLIHCFVRYVFRISCGFNPSHWYIIPLDHLKFTLTTHCCICSSFTRGPVLIKTYWRINKMSSSIWLYSRFQNPPQVGNILNRVSSCTVSRVMKNSMVFHLHFTRGYSSFLVYEYRLVVFPPCVGKLWAQCSVGFWKTKFWDDKNQFNFVFLTFF